MAPPKLYGLAASPPYRAVLLTAKAIELEIEEQEVDLLNKQEHKTEAFLKMNPTHTVPTLDDNGLYVWESRAIIAYFVSQYGKDDKLYPKEPKKRAIVDNMLYFDASALYPSFAQHCYPVYFQGKPEDPEKIKVVEERLGFLNTILGQRPYAAGDHLTIADFSIISSLTTIQAVKFSMAEYPNIEKWSARIKAEVPYYDQVTKAGIDALNGMFASTMKT